MDSGVKTVKRKTKTWNLVWTEDLITSLTSYYEDNPYLWDYKSKDYKNSHKKKLCLETWLKNEGLYSEETKDDIVEEVRRKFHSLRTRFGQEYKKIVQKKIGSGAESDGENKSTWKYLVQLNFLKDAIVPRSFVNNTTVYEREDTTQNDSITISFSPAKNHDHPVVHEIEDEFISNDNSSSTSLSSAKSCKRKLDSTKSISPCHIDKCLEILSKSEDREDMFFKYCASTMRSIHPSLKEAARQDVFQVMQKYINYSNDHTVVLDS